jgi:hypothetical protein
MSGPLRNGFARAAAPAALTVMTAATPITQPTRKGSAARPRFGDSKIKIVTVKGT